QGEFSGSGELTTTPGEVDAIFQEHLPREARAAAARGEPLRIVFWAHGGLVSESSALERAAVHVAWWQKNRVYPVYFIWETGLLETIGQVLERTRARARAARDLWDHTTDPLVEAAARSLGGRVIWGGMKRGAERASAADGGAHYVAAQLAAFLDAEAKKPDGSRATVEVHAVGHSAGSIFHAHFLPAALAAGAPSVRSLHFLAPAIRTDLFRDALAPRLGKGVDHLTVFTMRRDLERDDHCKHVYRKSLLYLIHHALEAEKRTPILGLEESLRGDAALRGLFGLGARSEVAEVVWSKSPTASGRSASWSTTHGGFDDDPATMNSVARRVLGMNDTAPLPASFPAQAARGPADEWEEEPDWPEGLAAAGRAGPGDGWTGVAGRAPGGQTGGSGGGGGRRRALCVGIDRYASSPLAGCVADARLWARTLGEIGFGTPTLLTDSQATRGAILHELEQLLADSRSGDVVVFQFAGHGTQLPDAGGDEAGGDTAGLDEALCPFDMDSGAFVIDDDVAEVLAGTPPGVNVTLFIDCCHSGTVSRFGVGTAAAEGRARDERPRFIVADPALKQAHLDFRARLGRSRARHRGPETMTEVLFSACLSSELAWESNGQGEFTLRATRSCGRGWTGSPTSSSWSGCGAPSGRSPGSTRSLTALPRPGAGRCCGRWPARSPRAPEAGAARRGGTGRGWR
ncbi:MAG TPA: caspase family protein, partial [Longimicrobiaceae bacterium]|nr:caspase family protein [Longimicrobiaceae bacterium]